MKKILMASLLAVAGTSAFAAGTPVDLNTGASTDITTSTCTLLATGTPTLKANLSKGNLGAYLCDTTTNSIGLGVASPNGKGFVFQGSSAGGQIQKNPTSGNKAPVIGDCETAATDGAASS